MKTKLFIVLSWAFLFIIGCDHDDNPPGEEDTTGYYGSVSLDTIQLTPNIEMQTLLGSWQLEAFVNRYNYSVTFPTVDVPNTCRMVFGKNNEMSGETVSNTFFGEYLLQGNKISFSEIIGTEINEPEWGAAFLDALYNTDYLTIADDKLFILSKNEWLVFSNRNANEEYPGITYPIDLAENLVVIGQGRRGFALQSGPGRILITDNKRWETLKAALSLHDDYEVNQFVEKDIDFSKYQVIVVSDEVKPYGGWSIDITEVMKYQDKIVVTVMNLNKGNITAVVTCPYQIVKIPVSKKQIIFEWKLTRK